MTWDILPNFAEVIIRLSVKEILIRPLEEEDEVAMEIVKISNKVNINIMETFEKEVNLE